MAHISLPDGLPGITGPMNIHDTVLIAAAFCMYNRYVDGLAANTPTDLSTYPLRAKQIAERGYGNYIFSSKQPVHENSKI